MEWEGGGGWVVSVKAFKDIQYVEVTAPALWRFPENPAPQFCPCGAWPLKD